MLGSGNPYGNIHRGLDVGATLMERGYAPYLPQLTAVFEMAKGMRTRDEWLALDKAFLLACDCLLRLDGVSPGADQEVTWAREAGIPCFYSLDTLMASMPNCLSCDAQPGDPLGASRIGMWSVDTEK